MSWKLSFLGILAIVGGLLAVFRPWGKKAAAGLVNDEGVGPAHVAGVPRGEEQILKHGSDEPSSVAGRIAGSVQPV
ncbi:MAG TPA: hypothetical protein VFW71_06965 [Actinomycetota bacterium]|nr:hypothetical protein [Actinomycetota bacterium]